VSCDRTQTQLHAYFDGELDALTSAAFETHLESCSECRSALASEEALRASIAKANLYENAPVSLHRAIAANLPAVPGAPAPAVVQPAPSRWRWLALAASLLLVATLGWQLFQHFAGPPRNSSVVAAAFDAHLRSLQAGHLADVQSTDQHTVKPWFDGKLDFAPPVRDFANDGFPLLGGRLDVLDGKTVAALVYGRRKHIINVFVSPADASARATRSGESQGYNWLAWRNGGFDFVAVSDVNSADLQQLIQLFLNP
jgi:anti-sigma factor (TIGR02949 family)